MYYIDVIVTAGDSLKSFTIDNDDVRCNGYVRPGMQFHTKNERGLYEPVETRSEYVINKVYSKPSVYKRRWCGIVRDEYKYAFSEKTTKTITNEKDVYYNSKRDRFITKDRGSRQSTRVEYGLPNGIIF